MKSKPTLLILDLDGTITKSDNIVQFTRFMIFKRKRFRFLLFIPLYILLVTRLMSNCNFKKAYARVILKGMSLQFIESEVKVYIESPQFKADVCQAVITFQKKYKRATKIIISANFDFLVSKIASKFNIPIYKSIQLQVTDGFFTGEVIGNIPYGSAKVDAYISLCKDYCVKNTIGIGDSISDLPLLEILDEGYIVTSKRTLKKINKFQNGQFN